MAKGVSSRANKRIESKIEFLPFRRFKDRPLDDFVEVVVKHLRDTAQPETCQTLYRNPIPKDVRFYILRKDVELDGRKRPEGDNAPCPMCATNKFLKGSLVYIPSMECCAFIGHCCADKEAIAFAAREYKERSKRDHEESYLLNCLPLIPSRLATLRKLKPVAEEARRLYRQFRRDASLVQHQLREVKRNYGGRLVLSEIIRGGEDHAGSDYVGPAGFKGGGGTGVESRGHDFGILAGDLATVKDYDPVKELDVLIRQLLSIDPFESEEEIVEFIVNISKRQRSAAVAIMETVDRGVAKFVERIRSFLQFFTRENAEHLHAFGTSPHNSFQFAVEFDLMRGRPALVITHNNRRCVLHVGAICHEFEFSWPLPNAA